ncbi:MAG: methionyl-tRNA formyltransferase [Patescibacteria group bacterium]|nr:methionyl-tRNA formyltransferase [Patescibacteria group bacterium]
MTAIRTIFIGTPDFAVPALKALTRDTDFNIVAVITQPDMPAGRGLTNKESAVKKTALELNYTVLQPEKISQIVEEIKNLQPDIIVVAAYAQLIPESILNIPRYGCINVHGSLLPKYRGAGVIQAPIINGDDKTGVTIMMMEKGLDTGPILTQAEYDLKPSETAGSLSNKLADLGAKIILPTIKNYIKGEIKPLAQDNTQASYVGLIKKQDGLIDWTEAAELIERKVRAFSPWPSAWTWLNGQQLKIISTSPEILPLNTYKPGKTFVYNNKLAIQCGKDSIVVDILKLEGKNETSSEAFINGHRDDIGKFLG